MHVRSGRSARATRRESPLSTRSGIIKPLVALRPLRVFSWDEKYVYFSCVHIEVSVRGLQVGFAAVLGRNQTIAHSEAED